MRSVVSGRCLQYLSSLCPRQVLDSVLRFLHSNLCSTTGQIESKAADIRLPLRMEYRVKLGTYLCMMLIALKTAIWPTLIESRKPSITKN